MSLVLRRHLSELEFAGLAVRHEFVSAPGLTTDEDGPKMLLERLFWFVSGSTAVSANTGTKEN